MIKNLIKKIEWTNLIFLSFSHIVAIVGCVWLFQRGNIHPMSWVLFALMMAATGLGITGGYHRLFSHRTYKAHPLVKAFFLLFGAAAFEGSAREWCSGHRKHHRFVDQEGDPYNINKGFLYAHMGWIVMKSDQSDESGIKDLLNDPMVVLQDKYYVLVSALVSFGLPMAMAAMWGDMWAGLLLAGFLRVVLNYHFTFFINSYCHFFGKQPYSHKNTARDSWFISLFTYGEGYHNFHHAFEHDYRNGIRFYDWDPTKWLIALLGKLGLAHNLKTVSDKKILEAKLLLQETELVSQFSLKLSKEYLLAVEKAKIQILLVSEKIELLKGEYQVLKKHKLEQWELKVQAIKAEIQHLKQEFHTSYDAWKTLMIMPHEQMAY